MASKHLLVCYPEYHDRIQNIVTHVYSSNCACFYGFIFKLVNCLLAIKSEEVLVKVSSVDFITKAKYFYSEAIVEYLNCEFSCLRIECEICLIYLTPAFVELCNCIDINSNFIIKKIHRELHTFLIQQLSKCTKH